MSPGGGSRSVYFSGSLARDSGSVLLDRYFFHFRTKIAGDPASLISDGELACQRFAARRDPTDLKIQREKELTTVELSFGWPTEIDLDRVHRLKLRRPRKRIVTPQFPPPTETLHADALWPADLYVGSGLSYEAGLPTLCDMHNIFCVDNEAQDGFTVGTTDPLPRHLAEEACEPPMIRDRKLNHQNLRMTRFFQQTPRRCMGLPSAAAASHDAEDHPGRTHP